MAPSGFLAKVLVLGATGNTGRLISRRLAASDVVTEVLAAGRNLKGARRVATELGSKATPAQLEASDAGSVATAAALCGSFESTSLSLCVPSTR